MADYLLQMKNITKEFPGVKALTDVDFDLKRGEVHVLLGENGAGKSTLIKIIAGYYSLDSGELYIEGKKSTFTSPGQAIHAGVSTIYQEFNLIPKLSVAENIFLGREYMKGSGMIDFNRMYDETEKVLGRLNVEINPRELVDNLGVAQKQMVEIAKAITTDLKILIMDEPTATLTEREITSLFKIVNSLKEQGVGIIYISHRLEEVPVIGDRVTVLRDGIKVGTKDIEEIDAELMISMMVGKEVKHKYPKVSVPVGEEVLRVENLTREGYFEDVSFSLHKGEIVGLSGLVGAGRTEVGRAIIGADKVTSGKVFIDGVEVKIKHPRGAIEKGVCYLPEGRKEHGLLLEMPVRDNIALSSLDQVCELGVINTKKESGIVDKYVKMLQIKTPTVKQLTKYLSGGNQQKVVVAKWIAAQSNIFIFDEPTRGVDVGAKVEIYNLMNALLEQGAAILMISSELTEIMGMSDRVLVMHKGRIVAEYSREEATQEKVLAAAWGQTKKLVNA